MLVTLEEARDHLRMFDLLIGQSPADSREADLTLKIEMASAIIRDYLKVPNESPAWEPSGNDSDVVKAAVLLALSALYDDDKERTLGDYMAPGGIISLLLMRLRTPALA